MRAHYAMFFIDTLVYFMFTAGVLLLLRKHIKILRLRFLLRHRLKSVKRNIKELPPFYRYIRGVLFVSFKNPPGENVFIFSLVSLFLFIFSMSYRHFSFITSFGVACMGSLMPILLMLMKVESIRKKGSKEGISVIGDIYRNYWAQNKNIFSAIEETVKGSAECPICKRLLYKLLLRLRNTGNSLEIKECIDQFTFSLGTVWGKMLGVCIRLSAESGVDVSEGFADISDQLKVAYTRAEERRRLNSEAARMTVFLVPLLYVGTVLLSFYYLDVSVLDFMRNQFTTAEGFVFFITISFLFIVNLTLLEFVQNQKIDY